jgi:hypothetical protein
LIYSFSLFKTIHMVRQILFPRLFFPCYVNWHNTQIVRFWDIYIYTGCPRRNGQYFGRVFLRSNYTDIIQNTYSQSSMVTEILAREKCGLLWCLRTVLCPWRHNRHTTRMDPVYFSCIPTSRAAASLRIICRSL